MISVVARGLATVVALSLTLALCDSASAFSKAIWGPATRNGVDQFPLYQRLGVSIWQTALGWADIAKRRPARGSDPNDSAYRWPAGLDAEIAEAGRRHMHVLLQIITTPDWESGGRGRMHVPADPRDFAAFAAAAARRYPGVRLWMIWGEPTKAQNFEPLTQQPPGLPLSRRMKWFPHHYARMLDAAYGAIKAVSRRETVIGGCTYSTGSIDTYNWVANLRLPNGRAPRMDMYGHNPFTYEDPLFSKPRSSFNQVEFADLPRLARFLDLHLQPGLPLFLSEFTIPTAPDAEFNFYVDPPVAGRWLRHALHGARRYRRISALGWIHVYDDLPATSGGLLTADGTPKPTFAAFQRG